MKTPDEFAQLMSDKNPALAKRPEGDFTVTAPKKTPTLTGFEYFWCALPLCMVAFGGAVGGLFGGIAASCNVAIFRSGRTLSNKYILSALMSIGSFIAWWALVALLVTAFPGLGRR